MVEPLKTDALADSIALISSLLDLWTPVTVFLLLAEDPDHPP